MSRIYVASSWRNAHQPTVVEFLRSLGHEVYDFRHPAEGEEGFHWSEIDPDWEDWPSRTYRNALSHPIAELGFGNDKHGMDWANTCVLVLPCGRSAHLEAGYMAGQGKRVIIYIPDGRTEPELMYKLCDRIAVTQFELRTAVGRAIKGGK